MKMIVGDVWEGRAYSTSRKYGLSLRKCLKFFKKNKFSLEMPFKAEDVAIYLAHLKRENGTRGAISNAKAALKWAHSFIPGTSKCSNPMNDELLDKIASGVFRKEGRSVQHKKPLTGSMINQLASLSDLGNLTELRDLLIVICAHNLLLRHDEISHLICDFIQEVEKGFVVRIPRSKTDKFRNGKNVFLAKNPGSFSASTLLKRYLSLADLKLGENCFLFSPLRKMASSGRFELCKSILPYASYNRIIKTSIVKLGLDPKLFGTHSCRAGGASDLAPKVSELELLVSGRWADPRGIRHYVEIGQEDRFRLNSLAQFGASADSTPKNSNVLSIKEVSGGTSGPQESNPPQETSSGGVQMLSRTRMILGGIKFP